VALGGVHLPAGVTSLETDAGHPDADLLPADAVILPNELRPERYFGAAPPAGHGEHRFLFTMSALSAPKLDLPLWNTPALVGFHLRDHLLARATLTAVSRTP